MEALEILRLQENNIDDIKVLSDIKFPNLPTFLVILKWKPGHVTESSSLFFFSPESPTLKMHFFLLICITTGFYELSPASQACLYS